MVYDGLDFILRVLIDEIWGWSRVIGAVSGTFFERGQQRGVEDVMNPPCDRKFKLKRDRRNDPSDAERSLPSRRELV